MKPIKIDKAHKPALEAAIAAAEGKARSRCLSVDELIREAAEAEDTLHLLGIPKRLRPGSTTHHVPENVPNSYKWRAEGTHAHLLRRSRAWYLTDVRRSWADSKPYGGPDSLRVTVPYHEDLLDAICRAHGVNVARPPQDVA